LGDEFDEVMRFSVGMTRRTSLRGAPKEKEKCAFWPEAPKDESNDESTDESTAACDGASHGAHRADGAPCGSCREDRSNRMARKALPLFDI